MFTPPLNAISDQVCSKKAHSVLLHLKIMPLTIVSQFLFVMRLLAYSAIASAFIKYVLPQWSVLQGLSADVMNMLALAAITIPVAVFAVILWLKR